MHRFTTREVNKLKEVKVFLCIPATGKSYLSSIDSRFVDVDQEEAIYKFDYDENMSQHEFSKLQGHGEVVKNDSEEFIHKRILEHLKNGKIILSATHEHIFRFLEEQKIPYVIIQYSSDDVEHFKNRMRQRGNTEDFIEAMLAHRSESYIKHKRNPYATAVLDIYKNEYLSDIMWEIFGKPKSIEYDAKSQYDSKLNFDKIDKAFSFYNIDEKYKQQVYICVQKILNNHFLKNKFFEIYETLFVSESDKFRELWKIRDIEVLFGSGVHPFVTNLMILLGMPIHKTKMEEMGFDRKQTNAHKVRVKECFINDLERRGYKGIRISQMLWATYFMNCRIIDVGILQYEYDSSIYKIKIHIPHMPKLDIDKVKQSLSESKKEIKKYFHFDDKQYICNSWLLSKQLTAILDNESNIKKFQSLFEIKEGEDCVGDILNHVYNLRTCEDYEQLSENSSLQRKIKVELKQGRIFRLGCGELV